MIAMIGLYVHARVGAACAPFKRGLRCKLSQGAGEERFEGIDSG